MTPSDESADGEDSGPFAALRNLVDSVRGERITPTAPPTEFEDDTGREVHIRPYREADRASLRRMYEEFDPSQRTQGVPPRNAEALAEWLDSLLAGVNVVARTDDRVVGHVTFVPDDTDRHELAIFVHQEYQGAGIGSALLAAGLGHARAEGVEYVWLSVEAGKHGIQRWYSRAGFSTVNPMGTAHRMSRRL